MSWTRLVCRTLQLEKTVIAFYLASTALLFLIFNLLLDHVVIAYPLTMSLVLLAVYLVYKMVALYRFLDDLNAVKTPGIQPRYPHTAAEETVYAAIADIHTAYQHKMAVLEEQVSGRNTMFTSFIHNMKTSAAVIELAAASPKADRLGDIVQENEKLKSHLEQALNILRLDEFANDYVPERIELRGLAESVINEKRRDFIYAGVYPKLGEQKAYVYTDRKWCGYIVDQIVANAIKYSPSGGKVFVDIESAGEKAVLHIRDEGIGIPPEDIPRVFDLFYTGQNGRSTANTATGIGLAIVKHAARQLGHEVELTSAVGEGTCVSVTFRTKM
ncbi:sensor histidine kinase [Paenibacillus physcomitrellae]|uniref:histidine kinase n=1 Tax=Paenibacillus physcomitrellae TaxID=1619311 RepID=A0ABQ1FW72_9BACL|nr:sensor histidine kinase [Paenibacillus physcomitrellae]GGA32065.1 ATP-binding protein [Paenibacillus physcomitrellae]